MSQSRVNSIGADVFAIALAPYVSVASEIE